MIATSEEYSELALVLLNKCTDKQWLGSGRFFSKELLQDITGRELDIERLEAITSSQLEELAVGSPNVLIGFLNDREGFALVPASESE